MTASVSGNKVLIVTGASSDMGMNYIREYHGCYDMIFAHYCNSDRRVNALAGEIGEKIRPVQANFLDEESTRQMACRIKDFEFPPTHFLHLAALPFDNTRFHKTEWACFESAYNVAFRSAVILSQACLQRMQKSGGGNLLFMLSKAVTLSSTPKYVSQYLTVKSALDALMKALSAEYSQYGIRVNGLSPGCVDTKFLSNQPELITQAGMAAMGQTKLLDVEDVVRAAHFLLQDESAGITGQNITLDGQTRCR